ncbi:hypothetical protein GCM10008927_09790 [Amylibacter ulvae]|uniref:RNA-binding protein n=1 Tax=Paramylibacter ulvae TaxID=1651968 RepID=A0ABQ3D1N9_9RHOB|nr:DciA family protein [Amylibacter ulvae]GHA47059.1 hypothetical protein GCM10008927_09790 [Amylibacter ulvae]
MARQSQSKSGTPPKRKSRGFLQTSGLLQQRIRAASEKRGFAETRLLTQWAEIAGSQIAAIAQPIKVGYSKQGFGANLTLLCNGANAPMLQMQIPQIIERVNSCYGYNAIARITLTQTAPTGFGSGFQEPKSEFAHKPKHKELSKVQIEQIETSVKDVADTTLKDALELLGKNILSRRGQ